MPIQVSCKLQSQLPPSRQFAELNSIYLYFGRFDPQESKIRRRVIGARMDAYFKQRGRRAFR